MKLFSQRRGLIPVKSIIQKKNMDDALRTGLWNVLYIFFLREISNTYKIDYEYGGMGRLLVRLWMYYFKHPLHELPVYGEEYFRWLERYYSSAKWFEVYDFIESILNFYPDKAQRVRFSEACNAVLERELSGYRIVDGFMVDITSEEEIQSVEEALSDSPNAIKLHLKQALEHYADRENPDYRNSIKESISAVEALCKQITNDPHASLGKALDAIERQATIELNPILKAAFDKLYGYTSNADGIRHSMSETANLNAEDAKYMLVSCSAFINYLMVKANKAGIELKP